MKCQTHIHIQIVFAVKGRYNMISKQYREELQKFITSIVQKREQKLLSIFCMPDHTHMLVGMKPSISISDLVRDIKAGSATFIKEKKWIAGQFQWQEGFSAFSYSRSHIDAVIRYILNQEEHHKIRLFREEYIDFLKKFQIEYNDKYLFEWIDDDKLTGRPYGAENGWCVTGCYKLANPTGQD